MCVHEDQPEGKRRGSVNGPRLPRRLYTAPLRLPFDRIRRFSLPRKSRPAASSIGVGDSATPCYAALLRLGNDDRWDAHERSGRATFDVIRVRSLSGCAKR